jgi:hypothetical protein
VRSSPVRLLYRKLRGNITGPLRKIGERPRLTPVTTSTRWWDPNQINADLIEPGSGTGRTSVS